MAFNDIEFYTEKETSSRIVVENIVLDSTHPLDELEEFMHTENHSQSAMALISAQKTMVLATCRDHSPWSAPVYYVYVPPGFFFFSSPRSRHIQDAQNDVEVAAAIFFDTDNWKDIQGVQMTGQVVEIKRRRVQLVVTGRYLIKFPFARDFLSDGGKKILDLRDKVRMYRFSPREIHYVNNRMGFGRRVLIDALSVDQEAL